MNKALVGVIAILYGVLISQRPEFSFPLFLALPYVFLWKGLKAQQQRLRETRDVCLRQKQQAEKADLPDLLEMVVLLEQVAEQGVPNDKALAVLVNFGCRLSLSNIYGQTVISLEDPLTRSTYQVQEHPFSTRPEVFELPGLRGGQKDRIGRYRFWRTMTAVCFGQADEKDIEPPRFMIPFDPETLSPKALAILRGRARYGAVYQVIWGSQRGEMMRMVL